MTLQGKIIV